MSRIPGVPTINDRKFCSMCVSSDGQLVFTGLHLGWIRVWHVGTGEVILTLDGHTGMVTALCLSPDGSQLFSGGLDKKIKVWNISYDSYYPNVTGDCAQTIHGATRVNSLCLCRVMGCYSRQIVVE